MQEIPPVIAVHNCCFGVNDRKTTFKSETKDCTTECAEFTEKISQGVKEKKRSNGIRNIR
jgi:hypothetical protein